MREWVDERVGGWMEWKRRRTGSIVSLMQSLIQDPFYDETQREGEGVTKLTVVRELD